MSTCDWATASAWLLPSYGLQHLLQRRITSPIATAARGRAALKGWCSVMVVGPALGLGPLL
jgi:hypothetical protein